MPKVIIEGKVFDIEDMTDERLVELIENTGAKKEDKSNEKLQVKELSGIDPFTIGIGIGAVITWIVYRVSQSQKEEFRNKFTNQLK